jgi:hypothetical protein
MKLERDGTDSILPTTLSDTEISNSLLTSWISLLLSAGVSYKNIFHANKENNSLVVKCCLPFVIFTLYLSNAKCILV